mmetsp:Transcript_14865/g.50268  ORF Transcript_14865/g.50268 Transcript_14865/m.50268 type:complete len:330 (+) Transcript_14865:86-1075(+)
MAGGGHAAAFSISFGTVLVVGIAGVLLMLNDSWQRQPHEGDVFLASYPRSGNNYARFLLANLYAYNRSGGDPFETTLVDFQNVEDLIPDLEYRPNRHGFSSHTGPRVFKSHMPYLPEAQPPDCRRHLGRAAAPDVCECPNCCAKWKKVLYLVRDGRDVLCSYTEFRKRLGNVPKDTTLLQFMHMESYPGMSWSKHVETYLELNATAGSGVDLLILRYEDMLAEPRATLRRMAEWAGLPATDAALSWALSHSTFEYMSRVESENGLRIFDEEHAKRDSRFRVVRKGVQGSYKECFQAAGDPELARMAFLLSEGDTMVKLGYLSSLEEPWW